MITKDQFTVLPESAVLSRFPGAVEGLKEQCRYPTAPRKPTDKPIVKVSAIGAGGWQYGVCGGALYLFNSVFHGSQLSHTNVYSTVYAWQPDQGAWVCKNA